MSFAGETAVKAPADSNGAALRVVREVKTFEAGSAAVLETAINAWLATLLASDIVYFVGAAQPYVPANNRHAAVVSYGYFVPN
jgi:hypothetical protein